MKLEIVVDIISNAILRQLTSYEVLYRTITLLQMSIFTVASVRYIFTNVMDHY